MASVQTNPSRRPYAPPVQRPAGRGSLRERFVTGTFWAIVASLASQVPSLAISILLGRILGLNSFGELAVIQTTVVSITGIGDLGLNLASTRYVAARRKGAPAESGLIVGFTILATLLAGAVLAGIVLGAAGWYSREVLRAPQLSFLLRCSVGLVVFEMLNKAQISILAALEEFRGTAGVNASRGLFLLLVPVAAYKLGVGGALLLLTVASAATCFAAQLVLRKALLRNNIPLQWKLRISEPGLLRLAGSLWLSLLAINFATWAATVILVRQSAGVAEMAIYSAAEKWKTALMFLPTVLAQVTTPLIANTNGSGDRAACGRILLASSAVSGGATLLLVVAMLYFAPVLMSAYGWSRADGGAVLVVTCLACVPVALYAQGSAALWTLGRPRKMLGVDLLRAALLLGLVVAGFGHSALLLAWANGLSIAGAGLLLLLMVRASLRPGGMEAAA